MVSLGTMHHVVICIDILQGNSSIMPFVLSGSLVTCKINFIFTIFKIIANATSARNLKVLRQCYNPLNISCCSVAKIDDEGP
jgi:hypothetical protein